MKSVIALALLTVAASSPLAAQSEIWLKNGAIMPGRVIEDDGEKIKVELIAEGGTGATALYKYDQLAPHTLFRLRLNKTDRADVKGLLELTNYALDNGIFPSARLAYDLAKRANETKKLGMDAEVEKTYARAAGVVLDWAKKKIAAKETMEAHKALRRLCELFPDREEGVEAAKLLEEIAASCDTCHQEAVDKKAAGDKPAREAAAPAIKQFQKGQATVRQAMAEYKKPVQVSRLLKTAIEEFESAQKMLDGSMKREGANSDLAAHYEAWTAKVKDEIVNAYLSLSNSYFSRQSNKDALDAVNAALLIDPKNSEALATRGRIQVASSDSDRWRW